MLALLILLHNKCLKFSEAALKLDAQLINNVEQRP
jgi:hypothetical protein